MINSANSYEKSSCVSVLSDGLLLRRRSPHPLEQVWRPASWGHGSLLYCWDGAGNWFNPQSTLCAQVDFFVLWETGSNLFLYLSPKVTKCGGERGVRENCCRGQSSTNCSGVRCVEILSSPFTAIFCRLDINVVLSDDPSYFKLKH